LVENHNFIACLNYHTFGNLLIYPWGYEASIYTPDSVKFVEFAKILTEDNNYNYGTGDQTVGYVTNGDSDDWMYGAENVLSFTPEAGESGDGFWPAANRIETISKENIRQNLNLAWLVNKYAYAEDLSVQSFTDLSIKIPVKTKRLGYDNTGSYEVTLTPIDGYSTVTNGPFTYNNLNHLESKIDSFLVSLNTTIAEGQHFQFELTVNNGTQTNIDTITKLFGEEKSVFSSNGSTLNDFDSDNNWAITTNEFYSAPSCITESVGSEYANNTNNSIIISRDINLTAAAQATVSFMSKWALEPGYDYVQLLASNDNGITWNALCGNYTSAGTEYQDEGKPLYDGYQLDWIEENINLNDYLGEIIRLKFQIVSDAFTTADGFYFDDLKVKIIGDLVSVNTEISDEPHLEIYPNPNNGNFSTNTTGTIIIKNMLGQEISFTHINKGKIINVSRLTKGVYFVTIGNETEKIIVQ
jgi:carboxypeptidase T